MQHMGGFNPMQSMGDAYRMIQMMDALMQRRLRRENPEASALPDVLGAQDMLGESGQSFAQQPDLLDQFMNLHQIPQERREGFKQNVMGMSAKVTRRRFLDFQRHLAGTMDMIAQQRAHNSGMMAMLQKAGRDDPELMAFRDQFQVAEQMLSQSLF